MISVGNNLITSPEPLMRKMVESSGFIQNNLVPRSRVCSKRSRWKQMRFFMLHVLMTSLVDDGEEKRDNGKEKRDGR